MPFLSEDAVYVGAKKILKRFGWIVIAGQPPSGTDHFPVVEVKSPLRTGIGSIGAFKPDLVAHREGLTMLVECKPTHSEADARKLRLTLGDRQRVDLLYEEIEQRGLFRRRKIEIGLEEFAEGLRGALAHSGTAIAQPDLLIISVDSIAGEGRIVPTLNEA